MKLRSKKSVQKRFKLTAGKKFIRRKGFKSHLLSSKSKMRKRRLSTKISVNSSDLISIKKNLPYK